MRRAGHSQPATAFNATHVRPVAPARAVPGVDMCNHSAAPNAHISAQHSPGAVQGLDALEDVCDPGRALGAEESMFLLLAGPEGIRYVPPSRICAAGGGAPACLPWPCKPPTPPRASTRPCTRRAGQEILISYGPWPDKAFLLLFGFLPEVGGSKAPFATCQAAGSLTPSTRAGRPPRQLHAVQELGGHGRQLRAAHSTGQCRRQRGGRSCIQPRIRRHVCVPGWRR